MADTRPTNSAAESFGFAGAYRCVPLVRLHGAALDTTLAFAQHRSHGRKQERSTLRPEEGMGTFGHGEG
jgi:hypothetical protein